MRDERTNAIQDSRVSSREDCREEKYVCMRYERPRKSRSYQFYFPGSGREEAGDNSYDEPSQSEL